MKRLPRAARAARSLALALFSALALLPSGAIAQGSAPTVTVHVDDAEAAPGSEVSIFLRTYAPRPLGQGQLCIVVRRPAARNVEARARSESRAAQDADEAGAAQPFAELLGGQLFSDAGDAVADFELGADPGGQELRIEFASPSATINTTDLGPLARLDFRLRDDVAAGEMFVLELDLARSAALDATGVPVPLGSAPGRLFVVEPGARGGAGVLGFEQRTFVVSESGGLGLVAVERVRGSDDEVSVEVRTAAGTATAPSDYEDASAVLSWEAGELGSRLLAVPLHRDELDEGTETVRLELAAVGGGARLDAERATAVLVILDAPTHATPRRGSFRLAAPRFAALEGGGLLVAEVERFGGADGAVSVDVTAVDLSAEADVDFARVETTVAFADGELGRKPITVELFDDDADEGLELAELRLARAHGGATIDSAGAAARLELIDDDAPSEGCVPGPFVACLQQGRFQVRARWRSTEHAEPAWAERISESSGVFWFFSSDNAEILFKVLDACTMPEQPGYWVSIAAATSLDFTVFVTDMQTGVSREYSAADQARGPLLDVETFPFCR